MELRPSKGVSYNGDDGDVDATESDEEEEEEAEEEEEEEGSNADGMDSWPEGSPASKKSSRSQVRTFEFAYII